MKITESLKDYGKIILYDIIFSAVFYLLIFIYDRIEGIIGWALGEKSSILNYICPFLLLVWLILPAFLRLSPFRIVTLNMLVSWLCIMLSYNSWHIPVYILITAIPAVTVFLFCKDKDEDLLNLAFFFYVRNRCTIPFPVSVFPRFWKLLQRKERFIVYIVSACSDKPVPGIYHHISQQNC